MPCAERFKQTANLRRQVKPAILISGMDSYIVRRRDGRTRDDCPSLPLSPLSRGGCGVRLASLRRTPTHDKVGTNTQENVTHAANHFIGSLLVGIRHQENQPCA